MPAEALYEIGVLIEFIYRCSGTPGDANPSVVILDAAKLPVGVPLTVGSGLTQIIGTKLFKGSFMPDAEGVWTLHGTDDHAGDQAKDYPVGAVGAQSMAAAILAINGKADLLLIDTTAMKIALIAVETKVDINTAAIAVVSGKADTIQSGVTTLDGKANSIQTGVDDANTKLDDIEGGGGAHIA